MSDPERDALDVRPTAEEMLARVHEEGPLLSAPAKPPEPETKETKALTKANVQLPPAPSAGQQPLDEEAVLRARVVADPTNPNA